jgi:pyruvate, water dikinase
MDNRNGSVKSIFRDLRERTKELDCLYTIEALLNEKHVSLSNLFKRVIEIIPKGFLYPEDCCVRIVYKGEIIALKNDSKTPWCMESPISIYGKVLGKIEVFYQKRHKDMGNMPFLKQEKQLLKTIGERLAHAIFQLEYQKSMSESDEINAASGTVVRKEWSIIVDLLKNTDQKLYSRIARKMANYLVWSGHKKAGDLIQSFSRSELLLMKDEDDLNQPVQKKTLTGMFEIAQTVFDLADEILTDDEILTCVKKWIQEEKAGDIIQILGKYDSTMSEIVEAVTRYHVISSDDGFRLSDHTDMGIRVSMIRHFFFEQLDFVNIAKNYMEIEDFFGLVQKIIYPIGGHGKLGGKSAGLFLAFNILDKSDQAKELYSNLKMPKTWYVSSDGLPTFMHYNNLEDVTEQKYKEIDQVRMEYPQIIQLFKNSYFPPDMLRGLSLALDDIGNKPLIVRSSSLLEDRLGTSFSGKYKSLFLANQGTRQECLEALTDAIAEVYASTFGPDPIEYRAERGLLDFYEEMGILIQEVVGNCAGHYFLPTYAGVAFSNNEFRWSPRIQRNDGLIRLVPGLGTRAVDRTSNDYPVLIAPGKPSLKVNITPDDTARYAPQKIDVINMDTNQFETIDIKEFIKDFGREIPGINTMLSTYERNFLRPISGLTDFEKEDLVVTFDGLRERTNFISMLYSVLGTLKEKIGTPVDIEFASDGKDFYLLQCRPQSFSAGSQGSVIPKNIPPDKLIFSANKYVTNGFVPPISHIVYVDPDGYNSLESIDDMKSVGRAVAKLNKVLPKRQFILIGPGRWGSRGDIKLGVSVTYSDFNNTAALIEVALKKGKYVPELSFGTHFFQDLVEANIRYLPLYPDDEDVDFNWSFFKTSKNILKEILPEYAYLADTLRIIDVPANSEGQFLRVLTNADQDKAVGFLGTGVESADHIDQNADVLDSPLEDHWRWRHSMALKIARQASEKTRGIEAMYLFGSTKNRTAVSSSDINLLVHFKGDPIQRRELDLWLNGWSLCLAEINYLRTGVKKPDGLLNVVIITDQDIARGSSYAMKIDAVTDPAEKIPLG